MATQQRIPAFDALRAFAALMGIALHCSAGYLVHPIAQWVEFGTQRALFFDLLACFIHMFRMPIFFFLAGFFSYTLLTSRGLRDFIKNRTMRILLPFLSLNLFFSIPGLFIKIMTHQIHSKYDIVSLFYNVGYLWFLEYLIIFYLIFLFVAFLVSKNLLASLDRLIRKILQSRWKFLPFIMMSFIFLYAADVWSNPIFLSVIPNVWLLLLSGATFLLGIYLSKNKDMLLLFFKLKIQYFVVGMLCYSIYVTLILEFAPSELLRIMAIFFYAVASNFIFFYVIGFALKFCIKPYRSIQFLADASYWIYITHVPVILYLQWYFRNFNHSVYSQFAVVYVLTLMFCLITYLLIKDSSVGSTRTRQRKIVPETQFTQAKVG